MKVKVDLSEVLRVLETLTDPRFDDVKRRALEALRTGGVVASKGAKPIPVSSLLDTYRTRRTNPETEPRLFSGFDRLIDALERTEEKHWIIYSVGEDPLLFAVFATEAGTGVACLEVIR
jgi:hypothetical protein